MKKCPFCAEEIQDEAIKCPHCRSMLDQPSTKPSIFAPTASSGELKATQSSTSARAPERTMYETGLHWAVFLPPMLWLFVAILMVTLPPVAPAFFVGLASIDLGIRFLMRTNTRFKLTTRRLSMSTGVLGKRSLELMLPKIESISVTEPIFGRVFGYGTVVVGGTGGTKEAFPLVPRPQEFRQRVQEQLAVQTG